MKKFIRESKNRKVLLPILAVLIGIGGFVVAYSYSSTKIQITKAGQCNVTCIELQQDKASPDTVAVAKGSFVQINSADGQSHSLSLGEGGSAHSHNGSFNSGTFKADEGWRVQFNEEGSYVFHDHLNPKISVLVVVYTPGKDYKVEP